MSQLLSDCVCPIYSVIQPCSWTCTWLIMMRSCSAIASCACFFLLPPRFMNQKVVLCILLVFCLVCSKIKRLELFKLCHIHVFTSQTLQDGPYVIRNTCQCKVTMNHLWNLQFWISVNYPAISAAGVSQPPWRSRPDVDPGCPAAAVWAWGRCH